MVRAVIAWFTAWLMVRVFGITPEDVGALRLKVVETEAMLAVERRNGRHMAVDLAATTDSFETMQRACAAAVHRACKYRNSLKLVSESKSHTRAVVFAKEALKS